MYVSSTRIDPQCGFGEVRTQPSIRGAKPRTHRFRVSGRPPSRAPETAPQCRDSSGDSGGTTRRLAGSGSLRSGGPWQPAPPEVEQQLPPGLHALAHAIGQANKLLLALRGGADDHEKALGVRFKTGLDMDAINPDVDVAFGREIALGPPGMLVRPGLPEAGDTRRGQPA